MSVDDLATAQPPAVASFTAAVAESMGPQFSLARSKAAWCSAAGAGRHHRTCPMFFARQMPLGWRRVRFSAVPWRRRSSSAAAGSSPASEQLPEAPAGAARLRPVVQPACRRVRISVIKASYQNVMFGITTPAPSAETWRQSHGQARPQYRLIICALPAADRSSQRRGDSFVPFHRRQHFRLPSNHRQMLGSRQADQRRRASASTPSRGC